MSEEITVTHEKDKNRYVALLDGERAGRAAYKIDGDVVTLYETAVPKEFGGRGIAGLLAERAFADIETAGQRVVPECSFMAKWLERHPEYEHLRAQA